MMWISIENNKLPVTYETGDWDGKRSDFVFVMRKDGVPQAARLYSGFMDGSEFNNFCDVDDYEIRSVTHWMIVPPLY